MSSRALILATVMLLVGCLAAERALAQATNLEAGKTPSQIASIASRVVAHGRAFEYMPWLRPHTVGSEPEEADDQEPDAGQSDRDQRYSINSEPPESVGQIGTDHLTKNRRADDNHDPDLGNRDDCSENETNSQRAAKVSPERGRLHSPKTVPGPAKSAGRHDTQKKQSAGEKGDRRAEYRRLDGQTQASIDRPLDGNKEAGKNHYEDGQKAHSGKARLAG